MQRTDVALVGAGPIGLEVAAALQDDGIECVHVEAGAIGSTMKWWSPGTKYFSSPERIQIAGVPLVVANQEKATREGYLDYLRQVALARGLVVRTHTRVVDAGIEDGGYRLELAPNAHGVGGPEELDRRAGDAAVGDAAGGARPRETLQARRVVLAIGNMHLPRMLGIPGEGLAGVSHFLGEVHDSFGERVLIVGGQNSAAEAALRLYRLGADVSVSYRGSSIGERVKPWLRPELEFLISKGCIGFEPETVPVTIREAGVGLDGSGRLEVELEPVGGGPRAAHRFDRVLLLTGYVQDATLFGRLGVALGDSPEQRPLVDPATLESKTAPGVYIAGTACGGSQRRARFFIETCHVHAEKIRAALRGDVASVEDPVFELEES